MIREFHFAALLFDSERRQVRCAICGKTISDADKLARAGGRWCCMDCIEAGGLHYSEPMLAATLVEIATQ